MKLHELRTRVAAGESFEYLYFWGHKPRPDGSTGHGCFSQWWPEPFTHEGERFFTAEHFMMAGKARLFGDEEIRAQLLEDPSPKKAKGWGRKVRGFDDKRWKAAREAIVLEGNLAKFGEHEELREILFDTGDAVLVEASPFDRIWGIGMGPNKARESDPNNWRGANLLGFILMRVRETLRAEAAA